jgi:hypothetical protein
VSLSDLYPERHPDVDGDVTSQPLDASDPEHLQYSLELAGAGCTAIITNTRTTRMRRAPSSEIWLLS